MCGISGIFSKDKLSDLSILNSLGSIKHRGTNNTIHSCFFEQDLHFYSSKLSDERTQFDLKNSEGFLANNWIGFNRLSILDLSNNGMQPFYENDAKIALMMNGEIYNFRELRKEFLLDKDFSSDSDTEVVFQLYLKLGDDFVHHLRGMFTIVIIDYKNNEAKIWRDRFGIKPFYYYLDDKYFIFSSETTGIFATDLVERSIDFKHLAYSFYLNSSFSPHTIYNNIYSLEAATKLEVDLTTLKAKKEIYWQLEYQPNNKSISKEEFLDDVCKLVNLASVADVKQAVMLSGGLDSGLLAYQFGKNKIDVEALTIYNTDVEEQNELEFAKSNAENAKLDLLSFKIENEVTLQTIKEYCLAEEEPNSSPEPAYFLSKKAFENKYTILHNALGLDELFYGYGYYHQAKKMQIIRPFLLKPFKYLLKGSKRHKYEEITRFGIEAAPFIMRSFSSWVAIQKLFSKYGSENWEHPISILMNKVRETNSNFEKMPLLKKISYLDFYYYISSHHSLRSDVPAMKNEIEIRFPYLDHLFVQKYFNISDLHQGLTKENNKPFLRKNVTNILPKDVLSMKKKGFSMPTSKWLESVNLEKDFPELKHIFGKNYKNWMNHPSKKWFLLSTIYLLRNEN